MFPSTITLYNGYRDEALRKDIYKRTVITGVHWEDVNKQSIGETTPTYSRVTDIVIPMSVGGYVDPHEYKGVGWTLRQNDFVFKGDVDIGVDKVANAKHSHKRTIQSVSVEDQAIMSYLNNYSVVAK